MYLNISLMLHLGLRGVTFHFEIQLLFGTESKAANLIQSSQRPPLDQLAAQTKYTFRPLMFNELFKGDVTSVVFSNVNTISIHCSHCHSCQLVGC